MTPAIPLYSIALLRVLVGGVVRHTARRMSAGCVELEP